MKQLLIVIIVLISIQAYSQSTPEAIDFSVEELSLNQALLLLSEKSGANIAFSKRFFLPTQKITLQLKDQSVEQILSEILKQTNVDFKQIDGSYMLFKKKYKTYTLSGYIEDESSGERLIAAAIYCPQHAIGTITNEYGFFSLVLPEGEIEIQYTYLGYELTKETLNLRKNTRVKIPLNSNITLKEVIVQPKEQESLIVKDDLNNITHISKGFMDATPTLGGEKDIIRTAQVLPGVQSSIDGLGGMQVRGGNSGQNLMLMDGVPIYIPFHQLGVYSIYNTNAINAAKFLKGSFPARYGGSLSSVCDVHLKEGNKYYWKANASTNLVASSATLEGPIKKGKTAILISGRWAPRPFMMEPILRRIYFQNRKGELYSSFHDLSVKLNHQLSDKDRLYGSFFTSNDYFSKELTHRENRRREEVEMDFNWGNTIAALRWNHLFNAKLFMNTTFTYSLYNFEYSDLETYFKEDDDDDKHDDGYFFDNRSNNKDIGLKIDIDYLPNNKHRIRFGVGGAMREFKPVLSYFDNEDDEFDEIENYDINEFDEHLEIPIFEAEELYAYAEDNINLSSNLKANIGLRLSAFHFDEDLFINLEPRLLIRYDINSKWMWQASASRMMQYLHLINNSALRLPNDIWLPASYELPPQEAWQAEIGLAYKPNNQWKLSIDGFYKQMNNLFDYPDSLDFLRELGETHIHEFLESGQGISRGIEALLKYNGYDNGAIIAYTLSKSERQFPSKNEGNFYPYDFDQRHQLNLFFYQNLAKNFRFSINWAYNSPNPQNILAQIEYETGVNYISVDPPGKKNTKRSTPYHRLDLNLNYQIQSKRLNHQFNIGAYNTYNRDNTAYYQVEIDEEGQANPPDRISSFPFIPSISYQINWKANK